MYREFNRGRYVKRRPPVSNRAMEWVWYASRNLNAKRRQP